MSDGEAPHDPTAMPMAGKVLAVAAAKGRKSRPSADYMGPRAMARGAARIPGGV